MPAACSAGLSIEPAALVLLFMKAVHIAGIDVLTCVNNTIHHINSVFQDEVNSSLVFPFLVSYL